MRSVEPSDSRVVAMKRLFPSMELCQADLLGGEESFVKAMEGCKYRSNHSKNDNITNI